MTAANLNTNDQVLVAMRLHLDIHIEIRTAAAAPAGGGVGGGGGRQGGGHPRPERFQRPSIDQDCTDAEWEIFTKRWTRYKLGTSLDEDQIRNQLWGCLSNQLDKAAIEHGVDDTTTEQAFLDRIKRLAVRRQNTLVNQVTFLSLGQDRDEPVSSFLARL